MKFNASFPSFRWSVSALIVVSATALAEPEGDDNQTGIELPDSVQRIQDGFDALSHWATSTEALRTKWDQENFLVSSSLVEEGFTPFRSVNYDTQTMIHDGLVIIDTVMSGHHGAFLADSAVDQSVVPLASTDEVTIIEDTYIRSADMAFRSSYISGGTNARYSLEKASELEPTERPEVFLFGALPHFVQPVKAMGSSVYHIDTWRIREESTGAIVYSHEMTNQSVEVLLAPSEVLETEIPIQIKYTIGDVLVFEQSLEEVREGFRLERVQYQHMAGQVRRRTTATLSAQEEDQRDVRYRSIPEPNSLPRGAHVRILDTGLSYRIGHDRVSILDHPSLLEIQDAIRD